MLHRKRMRKFIALTLLVVMFINLMTPTIAYALTSGPTQPEATSFEPVDTTDMVNLQTGDFTYNIPLLEVPGPEGGYPLSLSYHAGIQPNEDASWVGLGFTLNPGAVNRNVNGYPDDWYNPSGNTHTYWDGGTTTTYNAGISVGIANTPANVTFGLSFSQDTYHGFSSGTSIRLGGQYGPFSTGISAADNGSGGFNTQGYFKAGAVGISTNFKGTTDYNLQVGALGISIDSKGSVQYSLSHGGLASQVSNTKTAKINTETSSVTGIYKDFGIFQVSLGYSKTRYWTDEKSNTILHGSLYSSGWPIIDNIAYDTYSLLGNPTTQNIIDYPDPTKLQGGAYPDFDVYNVNAQGLGGTMRPYLFQGELMGQNRKTSDNSPLVSYFSPGADNPTPQFRFMGDFSNSYQQAYPTYTASNLTQDLTTVVPPFDGTPIFGDNDGTYGFLNNKLAGSKHIKLGITVEPSNIKGYEKMDRYKDGMIEGFSITNESGVTYHYALPAYSWGEEIYQERITEPGENFNRQTKNEAYAYTWYLTTITGPDFIDRNQNGKAGDGDWGYWVNFEYGKWSNDYVWRNPSEGYHKDEDNEWQDCSMGRREVYYLNAIRTRSHVAIFEKDIRNDAKGASPEIFNKVNNVKGYLNSGVYNSNSSQSLRLSKIHLFNVDAMNDVNTNDGQLTAYYPSSGRTIPCSCENAQNMIDKTDVDAVGRANFESNAIRIINLNYDYSLCPGTTNSYDINNPSVKTGKLTLKSISMGGKGGVSVIPPTLFEYDLTGTDVKSQSGVNLSPTNFVTTSNKFEVGDLVMKEGSPKVFCGVITRKELSGGNYTYSLLNSNYTGTTIAANVYTTKNPSYNKDAYDIWGMYKSDINSSTLIYNENVARATSVISAKSVDAWSLRTVTSSLGGKININYESDEYKNSELNQRKYSFVAQNIQRPVGYNNRLRITFANLGGVNLSDHFFVGNKTNFLMLLKNVNPSSVVYNATTCAWLQLLYTYEIYDSQNSNYTNTMVVEVGSDYIIVENPDYSDFYQSPITVYASNGSLINTTCETNKRPVAGNVTINGPTNSAIYLKGGGIRVKTLAYHDGSDRIAYTSYNYSTLTSDKSSGVTSYIPGVFESANFFISTDQSGKKLYKKELYKDAHDLLAIVREIPPPGVMYEYVSVTSEVKNMDESETRQVEGKAQYQFEVFRANMIQRTSFTAVSGTYGNVPQLAINRSLMKFLNSIGSIKRIIQYDNNNRKLSETVNHFLHDGLEDLSGSDFMTQYKTRLSQFKYQGYLQERYSEVKRVYSPDPLDANRATLSAREEYPCIQTGQTVINYKNGTQMLTENIGFDFYSGSLTKMAETDSYGNRFMSEIVPAYRKYSAMGLKVSSDNNKNMLTQTTGTYVYKVNSSNTKLGLIYANVQAWGNAGTVVDVNGDLYVQNNTTNGDVWRSQFSFSWMPVNKTIDGLTHINNFTDFNWMNPTSSDASWKKTSEITLFDVYSKPLEGKDINGVFSATRMNYGDKKVILTGSNANFYEVAYSGAEDASLEQSNSSFVKKADGMVSTVAAHTGTKSLKLGTAGKKGLVYAVSTNKLVSGRNYIASVWIKPVTGVSSDVKLYYDIDGIVKTASSSSSSTKLANGWTLVTLSISGADIVPNKTLTVGCRNDHSVVETYVDDFRFQPLTTITTAYVYDPASGELIFVLDNNNMYTKFEYDAVGNLIKTYKEKLGSVNPILTSENLYNYGSY